ncbi:type I methionyl aminopeptidase [Allobranchiibius sp. GilTou73]|uniref:type I methionyl aminopeptidase n=1 Tax=Allobranchiibius sp. GilTou73 TaxID=2904523 RepID=UPI001F3E5E14|nr:type I methionyl aminopeptidase [Allobranchiibius sp. GilTou73]UIJ36170.1 type I methionyl aminopeptidase [Allobranchiibius sp. GilTou73]
MFGRERLPVKTADQLHSMRAAGLVVGRCLQMVREHAVAGTTTGRLDDLAHAFICDAGAKPSFLGYQGFPATLCISVNDEVVHGIPGERVLEDGDLVSVDCGAIVDGWHGDAAITLPVGDYATAGDRALTRTTRDALWAGIAAFRPGRGVYELGQVIEERVAAGAAAWQADGLSVDFGIVDGYTGHGIGQEMHMEPTVFNERVRASGPVIREGATVAIEPMVTLGGHETHELEDGWTVRTDDGARAAHWEHTVAATPGGLWVLTAVDGGEADLAAAGATYAPLR